MRSARQSLGEAELITTLPVGLHQARCPLPRHTITQPARRACCARDRHWRGIFVTAAPPGELDMAWRVVSAQVAERLGDARQRARCNHNRLGHAVYQPTP